MMKSEQPTMPVKFHLSDTCSIEKLRQVYNELYKEHKQLIISYAEAGSSLASFEIRLEVEIDCRIKYGNAFNELKEKHKRYFPEEELSTVDNIEE